MYPSISVSGVELDLDGIRANSPIDALVTDIEWQVLNPSTGRYEVVNTNLNGFTTYTSQEAENYEKNDIGNTGNVHNRYPDTGSNSWILGITRNLANKTDFNGGALQTSPTAVKLFLRCKVTYNIIGNTDPTGTLNSLVDYATITVERVNASGASGFAYIHLVENANISGSGSLFWNALGTGAKTLEADLYVGGTNLLNNPENAVEIEWYRVEVGNDVNLSTTPTTGQTIKFDFLGNHPARWLEITSESVDTSDVFHCLITDSNTGTVYKSNPIELQDLTDPISFQEIGTLTVGSGQDGELTIIPYMNGQYLQDSRTGVNASNTTYKFELNQWTEGGYNRATVDFLDSGKWATMSNRFPWQDNTSGDYAGETDPAPSVINGSYQTPQNGKTIARCNHFKHGYGAKIAIASAEVGAWGTDIDYVMILTSAN